ncbi:hypothetical protein BH09BAC5_BH09BAC5_24940 [soil metagenome]
MQSNNYILLIAALVPLVLGFIWYNPKIFGMAWMKATDMTKEKEQSANMPLMFGLTYVFSILVAFALKFITIHQFGVFSTLANEPGFKDPNSEIGMFLSNFMEKYGHNFRTFKHGALHGTIAGFALALPIIGINALFERKGFKYVAINAGFWIICLAIMGGVVCQFS